MIPKEELESCKKRAEIFSELLDTKIVVKYNPRLVSPNPASVTKNNPDEYIIMFHNNVFSSKYLHRVFEHELSHIAFRTWFEIPSIVYHLLRGKVNFDLIHAVVNILEDYRVDSWWNSIYRGSKLVMRKLLNEMSESIPESERNNVLTALFFVRAEREDLIPNSLERSLVELFKDAMRHLYKASPYATINVALQVIKAILEYLTSPNIQTSSIDGNKSINDIQREIEPLLNKVSENQISNIFSDANNVVGISSDLPSKSSDKESPKIKGIESLTLKEVVDLGKDELEKIAEKIINSNTLESDSENFSAEISVGLSNSAFSTPLNTVVINARKGGVTYDYNKTLAKRLSELLSLKLQTKKYHRDDQGLVVDIEELIQHKIYGANPEIFFEEIKDKIDVEFFIVLDQSSSMWENRRIENAVNVCAVISDALTRIGIENKLFGFYSTDGMNYVEVHTIKSILSPKVAGSTPTLYALKEVCKSIRNFRKSVVVLVTDGVPNRDQIDELPSFLKFIRDKGLKVLIFFIDPPKDVKLEKIFGDKSFWRKTSSKTLERDLISFVVNEVLKNLRG